MKLVLCFILALLLLHSSGMRIGSPVGAKSESTTNLPK